MKPPAGLQIDLLTVLTRLGQIAMEIEDGSMGFALWLLTDRVIKCDMPRLYAYLTQETLDWADEQDRAAHVDAEFRRDGYRRAARRSRRASLLAAISRRRRRP
jgi:hypothetical protein